MPLCVLTTNLQKSDIPDGFEVLLSQKIGEVLSKPKEKMTIIINPDTRMCKNEDSSPLCYLSITSIGVFDKNRNPGYTDKLAEFLKSELKLPGNRVSLFYTALEEHMVGSGK